MHKSSCLALAAATLLALTGPAKSAPLAKVEPVVQPAVDGVFKAFETHSVVAIGDNHGDVQENAFYAALISDPRFAKQVGNVVVETASGAHQDILDRYVAGQPVPYRDLQKVWLDTVGWIPSPVSVAQHNFFAVARAANLKAPADQRIRVWAGEPPVDWSKIRTRADLDALHVDREAYPTDLVKREILAKGKKTLIIYGTAHFGLTHAMNNKIEDGYPGSVFVIEPVLGFDDAACDKALEARASRWPAPWAMVSPVKNTYVADLLNRPGCTVTAVIPNPSAPPAALATAKAANDYATGAQADGLLYLGPIASQMRDQTDPTYYLDQDYFNEVARRYQLLTGQPLDWAASVIANSHGPQPIKPPRMPAAQVEAALRKHLGSALAGKTDFDRFTPSLAANVEAQWPTIVAQAKAWGALKSLTFKLWTPVGSMYEADFEHAKSMWTIGLAPDGKINGMNHVDLP